MTAPPDERPPRTSSDDRVRSVAVAPLALWLVIQLLVLAVSAARVPLWYGAPPPFERVAAAGIIERDPGLVRPEHAAYRARIVQRYERGFELFRVG